MELMQAIRGRRATRTFTSAPVATSVLRELIDAAVQAPSAINTQPWHFTVIQDRALLDRISAAAKAYALESTPSGVLPEELRGHLEDPAFHIFYHAPALIVISIRDAGEWAIEDAALAAQNLMLAACEHGLGTCWIGFAQRWLGTPEGHSAAAISRDCLPVAPIIVGHPAAAMRPVPRKEPLIHWVG